MKAVKFIPNTITSLNLLCGVVGVIFTFEGYIEYAFLMMIAAAIFDFLDGFAARMLNAYSDIGKELDSLSDMVSFGVLPSLMLFKTMDNSGAGSIMKWMTLAVAVFSALRLAKFNVDKRQGNDFIGLATPSSAMICGSLAYYAAAIPESWLTSLAGSVWFLPAVAIILSALMVSEIPMFSMKFGKGKTVTEGAKIKRTAFLSIIAILVIIVVAAGLNWSVTVLLTFVVYILMNLIFRLFPSF